MQSASEHDVIAQVARELLDDTAAIAAELSREVHDRAPGLASDAEFQAETHRAGAEVVAQIAQRLLQGGSAKAHLPPSLLRWAEEFVHRGIELPVLLGVVRVGYAGFATRWSTRLQAHEAPPEVLVRALSQSLLDVFAYVDALSGALVLAYSAERDRWSRSVEALRADIVRSLLDGAPVDVSVAEHRLGHRLRTSQLAFEVWSGAEDLREVGGALDLAARSVTEGTGGSRCLLIPSGGRTLSGWIAGVNEATALDFMRRGTLDAPPEAGIRCAMGLTGEGPDGFRMSHEQSRHARRIAEGLGAAPNSVTGYAEVALAALASADPAHAKAFVVDELGRLADVSPSTRRIAETVRVYLEEGRNRARASRRLGVHSNTVAYRLEKAVELLGHGLEERATEVQVALTIAPLVDRASG